MIEVMRINRALGTIGALGLLVFSLGSMTACTGSDEAKEAEEIIQSEEVNGLDADDDLDVSLDGTGNSETSSEDEGSKDDNAADADDADDKEVIDEASNEDADHAELSIAEKEAAATMEDKNFENEINDSESPLAENNGDVKDVLGEIKVDKDLSFDPGGMVVQFDLNSAALNQTGRDTLFNLAEQLKKDDHAKIRIAGHADERGSDQYNMILGRSRSDSVRSELVELGVDSSRLSIISYGESMPKDSAKTEEAYSKNRRTEFSISL